MQLCLNASHGFVSIYFTLHGMSFPSLTQKRRYNKCTVTLEVTYEVKITVLRVLCLKLLCLRLLQYRLNTFTVEFHSIDFHFPL